MSLSPEALERIHELELESVSLRKDTDIQTRLLDKLSETTEKLVIMVDAMSKTVAVHDMQFRAQERQNDDIDGLIAERREEAHEDNERIIESLREFKTEILGRIEALKAQQIAAEPAKETNHTFGGIVSQLFSNWKWIAFGISFGAGIVTHKWGLLQAVFGITP